MQPFSGSRGEDDSPNTHNPNTNTAAVAGPSTDRLTAV